MRLLSKRKLDAIIQKARYEASIGALYDASIWLHQRADEMEFSIARTESKASHEKLEQMRSFLEPILDDFQEWCAMVAKATRGAP